MTESSPLLKALTLAILVHGGIAATAAVWLVEPESPAPPATPITLTSLPRPSLEPAGKPETRQPGAADDRGAGKEAAADVEPAADATPEAAAPEPTPRAEPRSRRRRAREARNRSSRRRPARRLEVADDAAPTIELEATVRGGDSPRTAGRRGAGARAGAGAARGGSVGGGSGRGSAGRGGAVTRKPTPINHRDFEPTYPRRARRLGIRTSVKLRLRIDERGRVAGVTVLTRRGNGLDEAAVAYARKLRFTPARAGSQAIATAITWTVHFRGNH